MIKLRGHMIPQKDRVRTRSNSPPASLASALLPAERPLSPRRDLEKMADVEIPPTSDSRIPRPQR